MKHKRLVAEWVEKAEGDFRVMQRELRSRRDPCFDAVCYHAQQCAEKFLKARLTSAGIDFAKTHSLTALLDQVLPAEPLWEIFRTDLSHLSAMGVAVRYPGESAEKEDARIVRSKRLFIHSLLTRLLQFTQPLRQRFQEV